MWLLFGLGAIVFAVLNIIFTVKNKESKWFRFASLSLTALTVCAFYADEALRVVNKDWGGLVDVMPTMSKTLWLCVILSIVINSVSLFKKNK